MIVFIRRLRAFGSDLALAPRIWRTAVRQARSELSLIQKYSKPVILSPEYREFLSRHGIDPEQEINQRTADRLKIVGALR